VQHGESSKQRGAARPTSLTLVEAFRDLPPAQLADLEQRLVTVPVSRDEILMRQGDPNAEWMESVRQRASELAVKLKLDPARVLPAGASGVTTNCKEMIISRTR